MLCDQLQRQRETLVSGTPSNISFTVSTRYTVYTSYFGNNTPINLCNTPHTHSPVADHDFFFSLGLWISNKEPQPKSWIFQSYKGLQQNGSLNCILGFSGSDNSVHLSSEPEPWLRQRFIAVLIWLYRVYRQLRERRQRKSETESLMKEIYSGFRFDNLYSIFPSLSSARLCRCCVPLFF